MAKPQFSSAERQDIYRLLFLLNRSFHFIVQRLEELGKTGLLNARDLTDMIGMTQEVQLEINTAALNNFHIDEDNDHAHFGKVRVAMEKRLRSTR